MTFSTSSLEVEHNILMSLHRRYIFFLLQEMTLEEYEKVLEEKRKALQTLKTEERKVDAKEFESMQPLANKKNNDDIFVKLVILFHPAKLISSTRYNIVEVVCLYAVAI